MIGVRAVARCGGLQWTNNLICRFYRKERRLGNDKNIKKSSYYENVDDPKDRRNHILNVNPNDEISPDLLKEKSSLDGWKDNFGSLTGYSNRESLDEIIEECREGEIEPHVRLDKKYRKHHPDWYGKKIEKLGKSGMVFEAIQVLEQEMLVDDRVMPNTYVFNSLLGILGRVGHLKKAYKLFNKMKNFGIIPDPLTYSALFNCCSNAYDKKFAQEKAIRLRELMKEKDVTVNLITYQSMIKAFAHLGDPKMAFRIADEAIEAGEKLSKETYSFILMAAMAEEEAGFTLAIKMWRTMRSKKIPIDEYHYNLLLRCARDCGVGNEAVFYEVLGVNAPSERKEAARLRPGRQMKLLEEPKTTDYDNPSTDNRLSTCDAKALAAPEDTKDLKFPNVLNPKFSLSLYPNWEVSLPKDSTERLWLLGGVENILKHMEKDDCKPTIKTFNLFLEMITGNEKSEVSLMALMDEHNVKPDIVFYNSMIKRRCLRKSYKRAKEVLSLIFEHNLQPDEKTFGCLSMGCTSEEKGMKLLEDMMKLKMLPNAEICNNLLFMSRMDFKYKLEIVKFMEKHSIRPNLKILSKLERQVKFAKDKILLAESGGEIHHMYRSPHFTNWFERFMMSYKQWLQSMEFEPEMDPCIRFDQPTPVVKDDDEEEEEDHGQRLID